VAVELRRDFVSASTKAHARRLLAAGERAIVIEVAQARGSVPRGPGTRMLVTADLTSTRLAAVTWNGRRSGKRASCSPLGPSNRGRRLTRSGLRSANAAAAPSRCGCSRSMLPRS
jgi:hypothetical protein